MKVATVECFTHCEIGMEIHRLSAPYSKQLKGVSVLFSGFFPEVKTIEKLLGLKLPKPIAELNGIKVYDEETDSAVALTLSRRIKSLLNADISIASSAGIGRGAVVISFFSNNYLIRSEYNVNLLKASPSEIEKRKRSAVERSIETFLRLVFNLKLPDF